MYVKRTLSHSNLYMFLFGFALIIGIVFSTFVSAFWLNNVITVIAEIVFKIIIYFSIPYLFFSLLISSYELSKTKQFMFIVKNIIKISFILVVPILFISILFFQFLPNQNIISLVTKPQNIESISITNIINNLFTLNWFSSPYAGPYGGQIILIPFFILALIIGISANNLLKAHHPLLELCNGFRAINLKILEALFPWFCFAFFIMITKNFSTLRDLSNIENFSYLLIYLPALALLLIFIIFPILIHVNKIPITYLTWCKQIIPVITASLAGGNLVVASSTLLHVEDTDNPQHKVSDSSLALSFIFTRVGTAVTIACSYMMISKIYTAIPLNLLQLTIIFAVSILFSVIASTINTSIILASVATLSQIPNLIIQNLYYAIVSFSLILHCYATVIDASCCGFVKLYIAKQISNRSDISEILKYHPST